MENQTNQDYPSEAEWTRETAKEVTLSSLDEATEKYLTARRNYEAKKAVASEASNEMKEEMRKLINLLEDSGRKNWETSEGKVSLINKSQYTTPKDISAKQDLAKFIEETQGKEAFWTLFSINSAKLNAWAKVELETNPEVIIPGLEAPTHSTNLSFRKKAQ